MKRQRDRERSDHLAGFGAGAEAPVDGPAALGVVPGIKLLKPYFGENPLDNDSILHAVNKFDFSEVVLAAWPVGQTLMFTGYGADQRKAATTWPKAIQEKAIPRTAYYRCMTSISLRTSLRWPIM